MLPGSLVHLPSLVEKQNARRFAIHNPLQAGGRRNIGVIGLPEVTDQKMPGARQGG